MGPGECPSTVSGSRSPGIRPLCLVFASLSRIPTNPLLVASPGVIRLPLGDFTRVQVWGYPREEVGGGAGGRSDEGSLSQHPQHLGAQGQLPV